VLVQRGDIAGARSAYAQARAVDPGDLRNLFAAHLTLPMICADGDALRASRAEYAAGLSVLETELPAALRGLSEAQALDGLRWTNFFLAYQGEDDRALHGRSGALAARVVETGARDWQAPLAPRSGTSRRTRVGFASAFFHVGTCGRYFKSWITDLDRDRFEVFVYHLFPGMDEVASAIARRADSFRSFGGTRARPSIVAPAIRADELDVLVYPELGMDACSFALASLRLAPRQYAGWGHPVTSGHATIDAFISCDAMEPPGSDAHYTERLVRLPDIGTRYEGLAPPADAGRAAFGLPDGKVLLLCPQSLWKIHPDNDALFAELLAANKEALLLLFNGRHPAITAEFMRRLERRFADMICRSGTCVFCRRSRTPIVAHQPRLRRDARHAALVGGNTSLDALACGLPIVTLPARMRGRQSAGMLGLLGVPELVARDRTEYLAIAGRLVRDALWRRELAAKIRAAQGRLFDAPAAIAPFQELLETGTLPVR
jgi:CRISPR-associated protein Csy1